MISISQTLFLSVWIKSVSKGGGGGGGMSQTHVSSFFDPFFDADASVDGDVLDLDGDNEMLFGHPTQLEMNNVGSEATN